MTDNYTNTVAAAAVTTPIWLPFLQSWSDVAALLLPIAGLAWLLLQIYGYIWKHRKERVSG